MAEKQPDLPRRRTGSHLPASAYRAVGIAKVCRTAGHGQAPGGQCTGSVTAALRPSLGTPSIEIVDACRSSPRWVACLPDRNAGPLVAQTRPSQKNEVLGKQVVFASYWCGRGSRTP